MIQLGYHAWREARQGLFQGMLRHDIEYDSSKMHPEDA